MLSGEKSLQVNLLCSDAVCDAAVFLGPVQGRQSLPSICSGLFNRDMFGSPGGIESSLELRIKEKKKKAASVFLMCENWQLLPWPCNPHSKMWQSTGSVRKNTHSCAVLKLHTWVLSELTILGCFLGSDGHGVPWAASVLLPLVNELSTPLRNLVSIQETWAYQRQRAAFYLPTL